LFRAKSIDIPVPTLLRTWLLLIALVFIGHTADTPKDIATRAYQANINALMVFTSQEGLNSGHYLFTDAGVEMNVIHLPFIYHLAPVNESLNLFIVGNVGYSRTSLSDPIEVATKESDPIRLDYDNKLQTYTGGLGFGLRYKTDYDIDILAGIEFIYSRTGISLREPDDDIGDAIVDFFNGKFNDNLTYKLLTQLEYHKEYKGFRPYAKLSYKLYETKAGFNFDELTSFSTQASVTSLGAGVETPRLYAYDDMYLTLEGYLYAHHLNGDIVDVVRFENYGSVGAVAYWYTQSDPEWAERFFLEISTVKSNGLEGYNLGIGFTVDF